MEPLTQSLLWCILQVTLVAALAWLLCWALGRWTAQATALVPAAALAAIVVLTACALAPWPNWWRYGPQWQAAESAARLPESRFRLPGGTSPDAESNEPQAESAERQPMADGLPSEPAPPSPALATDVGMDASDQPRPVTQPPLTEQLSGWLPTAAGVLLSCGIVLGLLQLVGGLLSVRAYRRQSQPLVDNELAELVDCLRAELCLTRGVELRESGQLATAATVGWRRPVILLPRAWRNWTADQCRAVLAHELAHVARGDYLACVLAQLSVALHFYHPLVHWLVAQLRLEQELAADAAAAELAGGRRSYLQSLAELALHTTERPLGWPAHTFLPTQGTFLRRIEMLRDSKRVAAARIRAPGWALRWSAVGLLVAGAALVAGLRGGPSAAPLSALALAQAPAAPPPVEQKEPAKRGIDLAHVPNDAKMLVAIRPAAILLVPEIHQALQEAAVNGPGALKLLALEGVEQITLIGPAGTQPDDWNRDAIAVVQFSQPTTFEALAKSGGWPADAERIDGRRAAAAGGKAYGVIDERTLALGQGGVLGDYLANRRKGKPSIAAGAAWEKVQMGALVAALDMELIRQELRGGPRDTPQASLQAQLGALAPLWTDSEYVLAGVVVEGKTVHLRAIATCQDVKLAENVADTVEAGVTLARNMVRNVQRTAGEQGEIPGFARLALETADGLLGTVKVQRSEALVVAQTKTDLPAAKTNAASSLLGAISQARNAARKQVSSNNLKQIALGVHNWADQNGGRFPPPVVMGKDGKGKVPHSWRVALLPHLGQEALYRQYNFDEPWDSGANKKVLDQMPQVYRHPLDDPKSTNSAYYVLRPEELLTTSPAPGGGASAPVGGFPTAFSDKSGMSFGQILDGTSNVLAVVEAKRDIPWTRPEDILFDPLKDPPTLGGFFHDGFHAAWCDGSVRLIGDKVEPKTLKLLIMPQDGQPVPSF